MPQFSGQLSLTTTPQTLQRPSARAYAALGVANIGGTTALIQVGAEAWPVSAGFRQVVPLPANQQPVTASALSGDTTVELTWYTGDDLESLASLRSTLPQATTGTVSTAQSLGTINVNQIEQPVALARGDDYGVPLWVTPNWQAQSQVVYFVTFSSTISTANTWQQITTFDNLITLVLSAPPDSSLSSPGSVLFGVGTGGSTPVGPMIIVPYGETVVVPITAGGVQVSGGGLYVQSATAGQPFSGVVVHQ